jgi:hypothetical protein
LLLPGVLPLLLGVLLHLPHLLLQLAAVETVEHRLDDVADTAADWSVKDLAALAHAAAVVRL